MPKKKFPYNDRNGFAYVYVNRKPMPLKTPDGCRCKTGTPEALTAYHRFHIELQTNPTGHPVPAGAEDVTIEELCAQYIGIIAGKAHPSNFSHYKTVITGFLLPLYGDFHVDSFSTKYLKNIRQAMVNARNKSGGHRFCRKQINDHTKRIIALFRWGVEEDIVAGSTWHALKAVKALRKGELGTFDHQEREHVPDDVVALTLRYLPGTVSAMVQINGILLKMASMFLYSGLPNHSLLILLKGKMIT